MPIDEDWVAVRVYGDEACRTGGALVRLQLHLHPLRLEMPLKLADIRERGQVPRILIPAGIEGDNVLLEHPLK